MLEFKSDNGNNYAWDAEVGLFLPFPPALMAVSREISDKKIPPTVEEVIKRLNGTFEERDIRYYYHWLQKWWKIRHQSNDLLKRSVPIEFSALNIKTYLLKHGLRQLTLSITEDCNFGCKYCIYRDHYKYSNRIQSRDYMHFTTAKKAIDYYFSLLEEGQRYNPIRNPRISFYGGEPLLNFNLIKKCVRYINKTYNSFENSYNLTTNGSILDKQRIDWLIKNNFSIMVSLDGPEDEHDRNRVYRNGKGTFKDVMRNIANLTPEMRERITTISIFDYKSDLFKREEFFNRPEIPRLSFFNQVGYVPGCNYYDQFSDKDFIEFSAKIKEAKVLYLEHIKNKKQHRKNKSVFYQLFGFGSLRAIHESSPILPPPRLMPFTRACIPGVKLFVDVKGNFHVCERVNETHPIGNVDNGLDFIKIREFVLEYLHHMDACSSCTFKRACSKCYTDFMEDDGFLYSSKVCAGIEQEAIDNFSTAFTIGETNSSYVDDMANANLLEVE